MESTIGNTVAKKTEVFLGINTEKINIFTEDGEANILDGVQNDLVKH